MANEIKEVVNAKGGFTGKLKTAGIAIVSLAITGAIGYVAGERYFAGGRGGCGTAVWKHKLR